MDTQVSMSRRAVNANEYAVCYRGPGGIFRATIETYLIGWNRMKLSKYKSNVFRSGAIFRHSKAISLQTKWDNISLLLERIWNF